MTPIGKYSEGSRKKKVYDCFVKHGPDVAWTLGQKIGLKQNTLRSWFSTWKSVAPVKTKPKVEPKPKAAKSKSKPVKAKSKKVDAAQAEAVA
jgi:hypothetical protein